MKHTQETNNPDFWSVGHLVITLMENGSVRYNGSSKYSPEGRRVANDHELQNVLGKMKTQNQKCKAAWHVNME